MQRSLVWKSLIVTGLALALLIPLSMIEGQIASRNRRQMEVKAEVGKLTAGPQQLTGPLLVLTYDVQRTVEEKNEKSGTVINRTQWEARHRIVVPRELKILADARVEERHRGLFKAQPFEMKAKLCGSFSLPAGIELDEGRRHIVPGRAFLVVGLTDLRGIAQGPVLNWAGQPREFLPGTVCGVLNHGIHADLGPLEGLKGREFVFELPLELRGSQRLSFAPIGESTRVTLRSPWLTPSYQGRFAAKHAESPQGFEATWEVFHLARNLGRILEDKGETEESFGVAFLESVNIYSMSERAVKYGFLFVGLIFAGFFFFEMLRRLPIHPIQYFLVGLALAFFFLLLISLSEHIPFLQAYLIASGACIGLLSSYLVCVLRSRRLGLGFGVALGVVFSVLYALLASEDNALLMGSLVLFLGLATVMLGTRKLNWYELGSKDGGQTP